MTILKKYNTLSYVFKMQISNARMLREAIKKIETNLIQNRKNSQ